MLSLSFLFAQVNTEAMKQDYDGYGLKTAVGLNYDISAGNSQLFQLGLNSNSAFVFDRYNKLMFILNTEYLTDQTNAGFAHLRYTRSVGGQGLELFTQYQYDETMLMKRRILYGGVYRFDFTPKLAVAAGFMNEDELLNDNSRTNIIRYTSYLTYKFANVSTTTYYQFAQEDYDDYRILNDTSWIIDLNDKFKFNIGLHYRYDNAPPDGLKTYDFRMVNGLILEL